jgi:hypothetical protein
MIIGQVLRPLAIYKQGIREDPRINYFYMQNSGSGKTTPLDMIVYLENKLNFHVIDNLTKLSDAYLTGSYAEVGKGKMKEVKKLTGVLEEADIIHFDEGETLLHGADFNKFLHTILDAVANPLGTVGNKVKIGLKGTLESEEEIEFQPHASTASTSYYPRNIKQYVVRKGLFQRYIFYPRTLTLEERRRNALEDVQNVGKRYDWRPEIDELAERISEVRDFIDEHREVDVNYDEVRPLLTQYISSLYSSIETMTEESRELACEFLARYNQKYYSLSMHHALLNGRTVVLKEDVHYADGILRELMQRQLVFLEEMYSTSKQIMLEQVNYSLIKRVYEKVRYNGEMSKNLGLEEGYADKSVVIREIMRERGVTEPTAYTVWNTVFRSDRYRPLLKEVRSRFNKVYVKIE